MLCGTHNIYGIFPTFNVNDGIFHKIVSVPENNVIEFWLLIIQKPLFDNQNDLFMHFLTMNRNEWSLWTSFLLMEVPFTSICGWPIM